MTRRRRTSGWAAALLTSCCVVVALAGCAGGHDAAHSGPPTRPYTAVVEPAGSVDTGAIRQSLRDAQRNELNSRLRSVGLPGLTSRQEADLCLRRHDSADDRIGFLERSLQLTRAQAARIVAEADRLGFCR